MRGQIFVKQCYNVSNIELMISGEVTMGEVEVGCGGITPQKKKMTVVKIEKKGEKVEKAKSGEKVNIYVKHVSRQDIKIGDIICFT